LNNRRWNRNARLFDIAHPMLEKQWPREGHRASRLRSESAERYAAAGFSIGKQTLFSGAVWIIRSASLHSTSVGGNT
jgi:hypothetical protein